MAEAPRTSGLVDPARLGGAAADFAAGLGRKVTELRASLTALAGSPDRDRGRNELRRNLHALGVGAKLLHFDELARAITEATAQIDDEAVQGRVSDALLRELATLLDRIPELAWTKPAGGAAPQADATHADANLGARRRSSMPPAPEPAAAAGRATPYVVLVVGPEPLARAVEGDPDGFPCEVERSDSLHEIVPLARAVAPDLVVFDLAADGGAAALEALLDDPLCGPLPIIALGTFDSDASRQRLVALGVTKVVDKPQPAEALRRLCREVLGEPIGPQPVPSLGEISVAELADVIAEEVKRRLVDALDVGARARRIERGGGGEVLGPVWGALARVRDVVEARSGGALRFREASARTPVSIAPASTATPLGPAPRAAGDRRSHAGARATALEVDLEGRTILLADDDPQVLAYLGEILRDAGANVLAAHDGREALALARLAAPDAIVSDVLMPHLDGVELVRALGRDVELHDRPVILLSWKEDLLQRLRDLGGASLAGLRKDEGGATILARVREVLAGRVRVEARIAAGGEVRGRLDGLSVVSLLSIVDRVRRDATVLVRDASGSYELDLDDGGLRAVARTEPEGARLDDRATLASLLGVRSGRFLVRPRRSRELGREGLHGELAAQLAPLVRTLRAACDAVAGEHLVELGEVAVDRGRLSAHLEPLPPSVRALAERLAFGVPPRDLVLSGEVSPSAIEDVLLDLARRGLLLRVRGRDGDDRLTASLAALDEQRALAEALSSPPRTGETPPAADDDPTQKVPPPTPSPPSAAPVSTISATPTPFVPSAHAKRPRSPTLHGVGDVTLAPAEADAASSEPATPPVADGHLRHPAKPAGAAAPPGSDGVMWWLVAVLIVILGLGFVLVSRARDEAYEKAPPAAPSAS